ncbi:glycerophosphodiester phosphodiesterase [Armatimonas sp.]|uniref:glycerophosphodiester phosphodiesterase n=1 Tax=Armatimonas sp. TaxID=1872638 RepID=UPI00375240AE
MKELMLKPTVIAHRGASGYLPEHTLEAKAMAHALGADYLEQDLVLTKDDIPVVLHDIHIDTISDVATKFPSRKRPDGRYYALDFTLAELKTLRVSERFDPKTGAAVFSGRFPAHSGAFEIPTLIEEIELIQGLNKSTGRKAGVYPELKSPDWHRQQGHDISKIVLPILQRYGYATKSDDCFLQCFELGEVKRLRTELGWKGRLVMLIDDVPKGDDGTDYRALHTAEGLKELAKIADGIGPALTSVFDKNGKPTGLVKFAHAAKLVVHPYTHRKDALPKYVKSSEELFQKLFVEAKADGIFSDFCDMVVRWRAKTR